VAYNERVSVAKAGGATSASTSAALGDTLLALLPPRAVDGASAQHSATVIVSPPCKTEGGWAPPDSECALPFVVGGVSYSSCAPASVTPPYLGNSSSLPPLMPPILLDVYWCPTSANYDAGDAALRERWGFCFCDTFWPTTSPTPRPTLKGAPQSTAVPVTAPPTADACRADRGMLKQVAAAATLRDRAFTVAGSDAVPSSSLDSRDWAPGEVTVALAFSALVPPDSPWAALPAEQVTAALRAALRSALDQPVTCL
jgi:hypothetical protein